MGIRDLFKKEKEDWLDKCRAEARRQLRKKPFVSVEDVLNKCPRPDYIHRNATGSIFLTSDFKAVGHTFSRRPAMNGREIKTWALR